MVATSACLEREKIIIMFTLLLSFKIIIIVIIKYYYYDCHERLPVARKKS